MFNRSTMQVICELDVSHIIGPWTKIFENGWTEKSNPKAESNPNFRKLSKRETFKKFIWH